MDSVRFDRLTKSFSTLGTRRGLLRLLTTLPLAGSVAALLGEESAARDHHSRRKTGHPHHATHEPDQGHRTDTQRDRPGQRESDAVSAQQKKCKPDAKTKTCRGKCGTVKNNCKKKVDCGPCLCQPACPVCQRCEETTRTCVPDLHATGTDCGSGTICCSGACLECCETADCPEPQCQACTTEGTCEPANTGGGCDGNHWCCDGTCQECCTKDDCPTPACQSCSAQGTCEPDHAGDECGAAATCSGG